MLDVHEQQLLVLLLVVGAELAPTGADRRPRALVGAGSMKSAERVVDRGAVLGDLLARWAGRSGPARAGGAGGPTCS